MSKIFVYKTIILIIISCICGGLCGCEKKKDDTVDSTRTVTKEKIDLLSHEWCNYAEVMDQTDAWSIIEFNDVWCAAPETQLSRGEALSDTDGDWYYSIQEYSRVWEEQSQYLSYLYCFNTVSGETEVTPIVLAKMRKSSEQDILLLQRIDEKLEEGYARIRSMYVNDGKVIFTISVYDSELGLSEEYALQLTENKQIESVINISSLVWGESNAKGRVPTEVVFNSKNTIYLINNEKSEMIIIYDTDCKDGTIRIPFEKNEIVRKIGKTSTGEPLFLAINRGKQCIFYIDSQAQKHVLSEGKYDIQRCFPDLYGNIFILTVESLLQWNVIDGKCWEIYKLDGLSFGDCKEVIMNSDNELVMFFDDRVDCFYYKFSNAVDIEQTILELMLFRQDEYITKCASDYNRRHPGTRIKILSFDEANDFSLNKLVEQMKAGKGPDLFLFDRATLEILQEAGCLTQLDEVITEQMTEQLFYNSMDFGRLDGDLYAIPYEIMLQTMFVSREYWDQTCWTAEEFMNTYEIQKKGKNMRVESEWFNVSADQLLYELLLLNLNNSVFCRADQGMCNFQCEEFVRILRFCKENCDHNNSDLYMEYSEMVNEVKAGEAFCFPFSGGFALYSRVRDELGDDYIEVGLPGQEGNSSIANVYSGVGVSAFTTKKDLCFDFIQSVVNEHNQVNYCTDWIRKDILRERVYEHSVLSENPIFMMDGYKFMELGGREDGSSFVEEYISTLDRADVCVGNTEIQKIILEEADDYFEGNKTEYEVAEIIQNRVQLYLNEQ